NDKNYKILEAGCGGGRIIYELKKMGYINLSGFDVVKNLINAAEKKQESEKIINFSLQNAVNLNYPNNNFDFLIYLQQIICFIENKKD
ncbi:MAG: class I SAM-dependent methyltransferase, partial [Parcubacteria group bacterium CG_4_10_14_0_2_um_filter_41_6]